MKKITITLIALLFGVTSLMAQSPQTFKYQAVARDNLGKILVNQLVGLRISILKDSPLGATMYMETHTKGTNEFGIVTLNVGGGTAVTGNFNNIDWSNGEYFIKTELDIAGTGTYIFIGSSQLLSVPFALHSEYATKAGKAMNDQDTSATNELQTIVKTGNTITLSQNGGSVIDSDNQTLTLTDPTHITISGGNTITLSAGLADLDADSTNEIQNLSLNQDTLKLSKSNQVVFLHDADRDSTNEIQQMQLTHNTLHLTKANTITIDADTTNEIQNLSLHNDTLKITKSNQVVFPHDADRDSTNEIQSLSYQNDSLKISKANFVYIPTMPNVAVFEEQANSGDNSASIGSGINVRHLNTTVYSSGNSISRNGDTIIIKPGIYHVSANASIDMCLNYSHRIKIINAISGITLLLGTSEKIIYTPDIQLNYKSFIDGIIEVNNITKILLVHKLIGACSTSIQGINDGENEVFSRLFIQKIY